MQYEPECLQNRLAGTLPVGLTFSRVLGATPGHARPRTIFPACPRRSSKAGGGFIFSRSARLDYRALFTGAAINAGALALASEHGRRPTRAATKNRFDLE
jgi:hypothetical protein